MSFRNIITIVCTTWYVSLSVVYDLLVCLLYVIHIHREEKYGRESLVIPVDFSGDFDLYAPLADRLSQLDIGVLGK